MLFLVGRLWIGGASTSTKLEAKSPAEESPINPSHSAEAPRSHSTWLRYLASCPACGERVTRRNYFTWQRQIRIRCRKCQTKLKSNYALDLIWSAGLVSPFAVCFFLALTTGRTSWFAMCALSLLLGLTVGYVLFPYNTKLEIVDEGQKVNTTTPRPTNPES